MAAVPMHPIPNDSVDATIEEKPVGNDEKAEVDSS